MANIEYFDNKMKTERVAVQARAATGAEIQPASLIRSGHGIPVERSAKYRTMEPERKQKSLDTPSIPAGVSRSNANVPTEQSEYSRLEVLTIWVLLAMLLVLSCGAFYVLWSKASSGW